MSFFKPKPGDLFRGPDGTTYYAIEVTANTRTAWRDGFHAIRADGNGYPVAAIPNPRPLVVIDPEDMDQVATLWRAIKTVAERDGVLHLQLSGLFGDEQLNLAATALREFANPTPMKPDEPTNPLAIVEDSSGRHWYLMPEVRGETYRWAPFDADHNHDREWSDIDAVKVLSPGVES